MKILITGGSGFIGSSLIADMQNHELISYDLDNSILDQLNVSNLTKMDGNILDKEALRNAMKNVDIVIHLAGGGGEKSCLDNPSQATLINILGTSLVVECAKEAGVSKIIFASSIYSYSSYKKRKLPLKEADAQEPDTFYGSLKRCCEKIVIDSGLDYVIFRFSNVYGVGSGLYDQVGGAIGNFIDAVISNKEITVFNRGKNKIDYINVKDVVRAVEKAFQIKNKIINVGSGSAVSVFELANLVINAAKQEGIDYSKEIILKNVEATVIEDLWSDISLAEKELDWKPTLSLQKGIAEMIKFRGAS